MNTFARQTAAFRNEMRQSCAALVGIVQGMLADQRLDDKEITFLRDWLRNNENLSFTWPADVIYAQVQAIMADGIITADESAHLQTTLQQLLGGTLDQLADATHVSQLAIDNVTAIEIASHSFCLTGDFVFGPRKVCEAAIERRGGSVMNGVTKKLGHLVVGGLGSPEWKHGSFGTKIEKAIQYKRDGVRILIVHEDVWANALRA